MIKLRQYARRSAVVLLSVMCVRGAVAAVGASGFDRILESAQGSRFAVVLDASVEGATGSVTVCLFDGTADGTPKAFDIRATSAPRFWTHAYAPPACARVSGVLHKLSFFSLSEFGETREILRAPIDLGGLAGRRVNIHWTQYRP